MKGVIAWGIYDGEAGEWMKAAPKDRGNDKQIWKEKEKEKIKRKG